MADKITGGIRPPNYIREAALARLGDLMMQQIPWERVVEIMATEGYSSSDSTLKSWRQEVMQQWARESAELRPAYRDLRRRQAEDRWRKVCEAADLARNGRAAVEAQPGQPAQPAIERDLRAAALLEREATRLWTGLVALDALHVPVVAKPDGRLDVAAMQPHERAAEIERLLEERKAALRGRLPDTGGN